MSAWLPPVHSDPSSAHSSWSAIRSIITCTTGGSAGMARCKESISARTGPTSSSSLPATSTTTPPAVKFWCKTRSIITSMTGGSTPQGQLKGIDLGAYWSNVQLVAVDLFDNKVPTNKDEMLVQNTVDHHLYEWWINSQNQLTGIDLGPYWSNVQLIGHAHYNESVPFPYREL